MYKISYSKEAEKSLLKMPRNIAKLIREKMETIAANPYANHPNAKKTSGYGRLSLASWRLASRLQNTEPAVGNCRDEGCFAWRGVQMKENAQLIERDGKPEWAVLPYEEYLELLEQAELLEDIHDFERINAAIERGEDELIPSEVVYAILDGENPIKVWREYRGLTQQQLADAAGISKPYISQIETGKRKGATEILSAIAKALNVTLDDVVERK